MRSSLQGLQGFDSWVLEVRRMRSPAKDLTLPSAPISTGLSTSYRLQHSPSFWYGGKAVGSIGMGGDSGGQSQMNSTHQRPGAFSCCFLATLLVRDSLPALLTKTFKHVRKPCVMYPRSYWHSLVRTGKPASCCRQAGANMPLCSTVQMV